MFKLILMMLIFLHVLPSFVSQLYQHCFTQMSHVVTTLTALRAGSAAPVCILIFC